MAPAGEDLLAKITEIDGYLRLLFNDSPKLNRDLLFHTSFLVYHHQILNKNTNFRIEFFQDTHKLEGDAAHVTNIAKARAYVNYGDEYIIDEKLLTDYEDSNNQITLLEMLVKYCHFSQINIKQNAFRVINDFLKRIWKDEILAESFRQNPKIKHQIFEIIVQSWEYPIRGFANFMEDVFGNFVKCLNKTEIYNLLDHIQTICKAPTRRRFASSRIVLDFITIDEFLGKNKGLVKELLMFDLKANDNSVVYLFKTILLKKFELITKGIKKSKKKSQEELAKNIQIYKIWVDFWIEDYIDVIKSADHKFVHELVEYFHPSIFKICPEAVVLVINRLNQEDQTLGTILLAKVGLIRLARTNGSLYVNKDRTNYQMDFLEQETDWSHILNQMISHSNRHVSLDAIRAVTEPRKVSEVPLRWEYQLFENLFKYNFKNSYPDFRNDLIVIINKLFQRLRNVMNKEFKVMKSEEDFHKLYEEKPKFKDFVDFFRNFKKLFIQNVYPDAPFESSYPYLQSMESLMEIFQNKAYVYRNKNVFDPTKILTYLDFYSSDIFDILVSSFKCQWDTVRKMSFKILKKFPDNLAYVSLEFKKTRLLEPSKALMASPVIKDVEASTYSFGLFYEMEKDLGKKFEMMEDMVKELKEKKAMMEESFLEGKGEFSQSLYHGILTTLSITICEESTFKEFYAFDKARLEELYHLIIIQIIEIINFSKNVILKSTETFILDNKDTKNQIINQRKKDYQKIIEKLDSGNTLLDAHNEGEEETSINTDNITVVAFYLVSKESGSMFAKISNLISFSHKDSKYIGIFKQEDIINLVRNFTEALLCIKHLGAIDNIANGLAVMCRCLYETSEKIYSDLIKKMVETILTSLKKNEFTSIFRRSAGLPSAITAFMKSEARGSRIMLLPHCMDQLLAMAGDKNMGDQTRIHSLNILKYVFQDSRLKQDLEHYIGEGLKLAIIGFTDNDWSIRNSSLMLYSAIISRMFVKSNETKINNKNKLNIIQFFLRAPNLIKFFIEEIQKFSDSKEFNQYPSLYPICLIFSKLLPYDMKDDSLNENKTVNKLDDVHKSQSRVILPSEIKKFKNLLLSCTGHQNYLGRVLVARAIVPFIPINDLGKVIDSMIIKDASKIKKDHNSAQGALLVSKFVLRNFMSLCKNSNYSLELDKSTSETFTELVAILAEKQDAYIGLKCTPVFLNYVELLMVLSKNANKDHQFNFDYSLFKEKLIKRCENILKGVYNGKPIRSVFDICESELIDRITQFVVEYYQRQNKEQLEILLKSVDSVLLNKLDMLDSDDTNPLVSLFTVINDLPDVS